jgi:hypothetical protein
MVCWFFEYELSLCSFAVIINTNIVTYKKKHHQVLPRSLCKLMPNLRLKASVTQK